LLVSAVMVTAIACRSDEAPRDGLAGPSEPARTDGVAPLTRGLDTSARSTPPAEPAPPSGVTSLSIDTITLALSSDGRYLAGGNLGGRALLWDLARSVFQWSELLPDGNRVRPAVFGPGTRWLVGSFDTPDVPWRLYEVGTTSALVSFGAPHEVAVAAAFASDGRFVTATEHAGTVVVALMRFDQGAPTVLWQREAPAKSVAIDSAGTRVAWLERAAARSVLVVVSVPDGAELMRVEDDAVFDRVALSADTVWASAGTSIMRRPLSGAPTRELVALSDDRYPVREVRPDVAVTRPADEGLVLFSSVDGSVVAEVRTGCPCELHALSGDGCVAACACVGKPDVRWAKVVRRGASGCP